MGILFYRQAVNIRASNLDADKDEENEGYFRLLKYTIYLIKKVWLCRYNNNRYKVNGITALVYVYSILLTYRQLDLRISGLSDSHFGDSMGKPSISIMQLSSKAIERGSGWVIPLFKVKLPPSCAAKQIQLTG